jgi:hypothetical protein
LIMIPAVFSLRKGSSPKFPRPNHKSLV